MTKKLEQCANCPADIYQASDHVFYHLKTGNKFCLVGAGHLGVEKLAGKLATPKVLAHGGGAVAQKNEVLGNGY